MAYVIDVHTHMYSAEWFELLKQKGAPRYQVKPSRDKPAPLGIFKGNAPFATPQPAHFDYEMRIADMNDARVDMAIVSLTAPNVYWGTPAVSLKAAQLVNDDMAAAQTTWPDRIRWFASVPWEHKDLALKELNRAHRKGAIGVMVLANIEGRSLTDEKFAPIWKAIDKKGLPVLIHPTAPPSTENLDIGSFNLIAQVGFMFDTTLAVSRMLYSGFLDLYPNIKFIASHCGGYLPFIAGRMDMCYDNMKAVSEAVDTPPSELLRRIYYDGVTFQQETLELCIGVGGDDNVMYGSDYPHNIGDMKGCLRRVEALKGGVRNKVRGENALRVFNL